MTKPPRDPIARIEFMRNLLSLICDMRPTSPKLNRTDIRCADTELSGNRFVSSAIGTNGPHSRGVQHGVTMPFATRSNQFHHAASCFPFEAAPPRHHVFGVILRSAPSQMSRIAAPGIIAGMERVRAHKRNGLHFLKRKAMGLMRSPFTLGVSKHELPVSVAIERGCPKPAFVRPAPINLAVKSLVHRLYTIPLCWGECNEMTA